MRFFGPTGKPTPAPAEYADGTAWIWVTAGATAHVRAIMRNRRNVKAVAFLGSDDPLPFLVDLVAWAWNGFKRLLSPLLRK